MEAKLLCTAGPAEGSEYLLRGEEAVVGRAAENPVSVPDTSVSRRHVQLSRTSDGWKAKDLGSGNGTLLNGEKLEAESPLHNGDTLTLGNTRLTFQDVANSTDRVAVPSRPVIPRRPTSSLRPEVRPRVSRQMPAARTGNPRGVRIVVLGVLLVVMAAGVGLIRLKKKSDEEGRRRDAIRQQMQQKEKLIAESMQAGTNAAREGDWKAALGHFKEVQKEAPGYPELNAYLERAPKELAIQKKLDGAEAALGKGKLGEAAEWLNQANTDGALYNPRMHDLQGALERKEESRLGEARAALQDGDAEKARDLATDLVKASPDNRDAQVVVQQAEDTLSKKNRGGAHITTPTHPVVQEVRVWEPAVQRYLDGDVAGATALANGCAATAPRCRDMLRQLAEFNELHKKMDDLDPKSLKRLVQIDRELGEGKSSKLVRPATLRLANSLYKQASSAQTSGDIARAIELARQVLVLDPGNTGAQAIVDGASRKSKELYLQAYSLQEGNPDEAVKLLHQVIEMTPPDDESHRKAQKLLEKMSR